MSDILNVFGVEYTGVNGIRAYDPNGVLKTYIRPSGSQAITQNNTYDVSALAQVVVNVESSSGTYQDKTGIDPSMSSQTIVPDDGYDALSSVQINAMPSGSAATPATTITANPTISVNSTTGVITASVTGSKTIIPTVSAGYVSSGTSGTVSVSGSNTSNLSVQAAKTVTPTETEQTAVAAGKYTTGDVKVAAISSTYVGSGITGRSSTDLTASGATVTVPAGYYSAQATKSVATATHPKPTVSVDTTNGLITATHTQTAGYVSAGTTTETSQLSPQSAKTVTPTETEQTAVAAGKYTTGAVKVAAISSTYVGSGITQRDETDLSASGATVTVPAGYYAEQETKSVATVTQASPTVSVNTATGLITATHTQSAGYVAAGTKTGTSQLSTQAAATITPTKSEQTAVAANKYTTGVVKVAPIPNEYIVPTGSQTITQNNTYDVSALAEVVVAVENESGSVSWQQIADQDITVVSDNPNYFIINNYTTPFAANETYRVTWGSGGTQYICQTIQDETGGSYDGYIIGNPGVVGKTPNTGEPFLIYRNSATRLAGATNASAGTLHITIERQTSSGGNFQAKTGVTPSTSSQIIVADDGYDALSSVQINAMPSGTVTAPASISGTSASVSTGTNTITLTKTVSVTPNVSTAGYISAGTAGNSSVSLTASVTTKAAATITPTKSAQTIASGTYLTGTQTIAAIPAAYQDVTGVTAAAGDVVSGKTIVSSTGATVNGSLVIQHYYTGSTAPSSSLGANGDIYLQA